MKSVRNFALATLALAASLGAQAAGFQNGSFESGSFTDTNNIYTGPYFTGSSQTYLGNFIGDFGGDKTMALFAGNTAMTGWTVSVPGAIAWIDNSNPWSSSVGMTTPNGAKFLDLTGWSSEWSGLQNYSGAGTVETAAYRSVVSQTFDTVAGTTYTVSFDVGFGPDSNSTGDSMGHPVLNSSVDVGLNGVYNTFSSAANGWATKSFTFTANSASTTLSFKTSDTYSEYVGLDNVSVNAVPEPETYAMMLAGLGALGFLARRRKLQ